MEPTNKSARALALLIIATLLSAARKAAGTPSNAKDNFDDAEGYVAEAEKRGLNLEKMGD